MDLSKMTARVRHSADASDAGSGMLTVEVTLSSENSSDYTVTSHSHSAKEIYDAYEAGAWVRIVAQMPAQGQTGYLILPLASVIYNGDDSRQMLFTMGTLMCAVNYLGDAEVWTFQLSAE